MLNEVFGWLRVKFVPPFLYEGAIVLPKWIGLGLINAKAFFIEVTQPFRITYPFLIIWDGEKKLCIIRLFYWFSDIAEMINHRENWVRKVISKNTEMVILKENQGRCYIEGFKIEDEIIISSNFERRAYKKTVPLRLIFSNTEQVISFVQEKLTHWEDPLWNLKLPESFSVETLDIK